MVTHKRTMAARNEARTLAFRKRLEAKRAEKKLREEDDNIVKVGDVKLNAAETEVVFADEDKNIQVVVSPDPENENSVTVAVLTNSEEDVEKEEVLGSASVEGSEETKDAEESRKAASREAFRKRLEARRSALLLPPAMRLVQKHSASDLKPAVLQRSPNPRNLLQKPVRRLAMKPVRSSVPKSAKSPYFINSFALS